MRGLWRCLDYNQAPADASAIEGLVSKLTEAEGSLASDDVERAATYGINTKDAIRVAFCGQQALADPAGDVQAAFDIGFAVPGREGAFVRIHGRREIWSIDANPRLELDKRVAPGLPPLLDAAQIPKSWPGWQKGLARVFVDFAGGEGFELQRRGVALEPEELQQGRVPWVWILDPGPQELPAGELQATAYSLFLQFVPFREVLDPADRADFDLERPLATITLAPAEGEPLQLLVARRKGGGLGSFVPWSGTLYSIDPQWLPLIAPDRELFEGPSDNNPWDAHLTQATR